MADQTAAASSPAEVDVFAGKELSFEEFSRYRKDPEKFTAEPAETAPADAPKRRNPRATSPKAQANRKRLKKRRRKSRTLLPSSALVS
jgi:hypothetical protein